MKTTFFALIPALLFLTACDSTGGFPTESSRQPFGNPQSPIVLVEYADLQCPACKSAHETVIKPLLDEYGSQIRYEFKHFPLRQIHSYALLGAKASECAADQGKFWEYIDYAYANQEDLIKAASDSWGQAIGVADIESFVACSKSEAKRDTVLADYDEGRELGVQGTPTLFLNGTKVTTSLPGLRAAIDAEIARIESQL